MSFSGVFYRANHVLFSTSAFKVKSRVDLCVIWFAGLNKAIRGNGIEGAMQRSLFWCPASLQHWQALSALSAQKPIQRTRLMSVLKGPLVLAFRPCLMATFLTRLSEISPLTLMLLVANLANTKWCKKTEKNDWNPGILIWHYSERDFQWIPTWQGLDGFQKSLHPCDLDESSLSIHAYRFPWPFSSGPVKKLWIQSLLHKILEGDLWDEC